MAMDPMLGKIVSTAVETQTKQMPGQGGGAGGLESKFSQVMDQMSSQENVMMSLGIHPNDLNPGTEKVQSIQAQELDIPTDTLLEATSTEPGWGLVNDLLKDVVVASDRMDFLTTEILSGGTAYSNQQLLALQAKIMKFQQITEVTVKLASETVSSLKQSLNTQVA